MLLIPAGTRHLLYCWTPTTNRLKGRAAVIVLIRKGVQLVFVNVYVDVQIILYRDPAVNLDVDVDVHIYTFSVFNICSAIIIDKGIKKFDYRFVWHLSNNLSEWFKTKNREHWKNVCVAFVF